MTMKNNKLLFVIIVSLGTTAACAQADPCSWTASQLRDTTQKSIGNQNKTEALLLANCLVLKEPDLDSNYILLAMAYLSDSITERNSHSDTLMAIHNFKAALMLRKSYHVANAIGSLFKALGPYPYDSALTYYTQSTIINDDQEEGHRELSAIYEAIADSSYKICSDLVSKIDTLLFQEENLRRQNLFMDADAKSSEIKQARASFNMHLDTTSSFYLLALERINKCIAVASARTRDVITYRKIKVAITLKQNEYSKTPDYSSAISDLKILSTQGDSLLRGNAFYFLGDIYQKNEDLDLAIENYEFAVEADPGSAMYWEAYLRAVNINCARNSKCSGDKEEYALSNLLRLDPDQQAYYFRLGFLYDSLGFNDKKVELYTNAANRFGAAQTYFADWMTDYREVIPEINTLEQFISQYPVQQAKFTPAGPDYYQALRMLGTDYLKIDNFIKAGFVIERLIHFYPDDDSLKMMLSGIYIQEDLLRNSLKLARKGKRQGKDFLDYKLIAFDLQTKDAHMRSRWNYKKAIKQIKKLIDEKHSTSILSPSGPDIEELKAQGRTIYTQIANDFFERKKYKKGKKFMDKVKEFAS
jgi:tetratricopeptide (TPR) repeat protein